MADTDISVTEILRKAFEADIEKRVYERIRSDLVHLKFIGGFVGGLVGILLLLLLTFHQQIFDTVVDWGGRNLEDRINSSITTANNKLDVTRDLFFKDQDTLVSKMHGMRDEISTISDDLKVREREVSDLVSVLSETSDTTRDRIATAQSEALARAKEQTDSLAAKIAALQKAIAADLKKSGPNVSSAEVDKVDVKVTTNVDRKPVVYFQFAGLERKDAEQISKALQDAGWTIPGEERTPKAVKTNEIRFNPADAKDAEDLRTLTNKILSDLKLQITLERKPKSDAKPGFVEIWIHKR